MGERLTCNRLAPNGSGPALELRVLPLRPARHRDPERPTAPPPRAPRPTGTAGARAGSGELTILAVGTDNPTPDTKPTQGSGHADGLNTAQHWTPALVKPTIYTQCKGNPIAEFAE
ncbi:uncharacterized protein LOC116983704 isoform X2 [Amblyraja radiata]|uniref:uncharacterized protein LOC116983704 isoform X2 n=1 Tax=Amblyraja radiata TaxID=386614 RepID=UPI001403B0B3|nr:uncharacterized protein LOC116983704 isoform X2 [Amblyraja radiata]